MKYNQSEIIEPFDQKSSLEFLMPNETIFIFESARNDKIPFWFCSGVDVVDEVEKIINNQNGKGIDDDLLQKALLYDLKAFYSVTETKTKKKIGRFIITNKTSEIIKKPWKSIHIKGDYFLSMFLEKVMPQNNEVLKLTKNEMKKYQNLTYLDRQGRIVLFFGDCELEVSEEPEQ